jgi:hypothetical protein
MRSLIVRRPELESLGVLVRFDEIQKFQGFGFCFQLFGPRELDFERSTERCTINSQTLCKCDSMMRSLGRIECFAKFDWSPYREFRDRHSFLISMAAFCVLADAAVLVRLLTIDKRVPT